MNQPFVQLGCVDNLFSRQMVFQQVGDMEVGHTHQFNHLTLLAYGSLRVTVNGKTTDFHAPQMIFIKADQVHELVALQVGTVAYCIHALRDGHRVEDILDASMVPDGVDPRSLALPVVCNASADGRPSPTTSQEEQAAHAAFFSPGESERT